MIRDSGEVPTRPQTTGVGKANSVRIGYRNTHDTATTV
jgi:hypothetical protein